MHFAKLFSKSLTNASICRVVFDGTTFIWLNSDNLNHLESFAVFFRNVRIQYESFPPPKLQTKIAVIHAIWTLKMVMILLLLLKPLFMQLAPLLFSLFCLAFFFLFKWIFNFSINFCALFRISSIYTFLALYALYECFLFYLTILSHCR